MRLDIGRLVMILLGSLAVSVSAFEASAQISPPAAGAAPATPARYETQLVAEAQSPTLCEANPARVHVTYPGGSACIAYFISSGPVQPGPTVFYFHGDIPVETLGPAHQRLEATHRSVQRWSETTLTRYVYVSRPGLFGSSGNHARRRTPSEMLAMNATVDAIKARHEIDQIVLAGQSGGTTVAASLLTLGRSDVTCAILGSGNYYVVEATLAFRQREGYRPIPAEELRRTSFDPSDRFDGIVATENRRIFVIGDPADTRTLFEQQMRFAERLRGLGHHAVTVAAVGTGELMHGVTHLALPVAGQCARGINDDGIVQYLEIEKQRALGQRAVSLGGRS